MGCTYQFECPACGYGAKVSGGPDVGFGSVTDTFVCKDCQELHDICLSTEPWNPPHLRNKRVPHCPESDSHRVVRWREKLCPKCGGTMKRSEEPIIMWD